MPSSLVGGAEPLAMVTSCSAGLTSAELPQPMVLNVLYVVRESTRGFLIPLMRVACFF